MQTAPSLRASLLLVALVATLASLSVLKGDFLADDFAYVGLGPRPWAEFLRFGDLSESAWRADTPLDEPRPVFVATYKLDFLLHGPSALGFHATNLALHVACCMALVALVARLAGGAGLPSLFAGLAFALLPVHAEPIAWITGRVDLLATLFFLLAFTAYLRHDAGGRVGDRWLALGWFVLGLISKETIAVLPLVCLGWQALRRAPHFLRRARGVVPYFGLLALYAALRFAAFDTAARENRLSLRRTTQFLERQAFYVDQLLMPSVLLVSVIVALGLVALVRRRGPEWRPVAFFGIVFYALSVLPLFMTYRSARHLYMPSVGFAIALAFLLLPAGARLLPWRGPAAALLLLAFGVGLHTAEASWIAAGEMSRRYRQEVEAATRELPAGSVVVFEDVPRLQAGVLGWDFALPFALRPPFVARDVLAGLSPLEDPGLYCCPMHVWWSERKAAFEGLIADVPEGHEVFVFDWERKRGHLEVFEAHLAAAEVRESLEEVLARPVADVESVDGEVGSRLVRSVARLVRHASRAAPSPVAPIR